MNEEKKQPIKVYELKEVSELLKINIRVLRQYIKGGEIKASKIGRKYVITEESINDFVKKNEVKKFSKDALALTRYISEEVRKNPNEESITIDLDKYLEAIGQPKVNEEKQSKIIKDALKTLATEHYNIEKDTEKGHLQASGTLISSFSIINDKEIVIELGKVSKKLLENNIIPITEENLKK
jgi:excisionase family DNA binding protein